MAQYVHRYPTDAKFRTVPPSSGADTTIEACDQDEALRNDPERSCATFARLLQTYRERSGYSQARLAYLTSFNHGHISKLEAGKRDPSLAAVARIAAALLLTERDTLRLALAAGHWPYHGELSDEAIDQIMEAVSE